MSDYIKREDVIKGLEQWKETQINDITDEIWNRGIEACINEVKHHIPSVDVVEVKHGHWYEKQVDSIFGIKHILTCSECGGTFSTTDEALPYEKYCRECGARMDGESDE